jgi:hypothetical protein
MIDFIIRIKELLSNEMNNLLADLFHNHNIIYTVQEKRIRLQILFSPLDTSPYTYHNNDNAHKDLFSQHRRQTQNE